MVTFVTTPPTTVMSAVAPVPVPPVSGSAVYTPSVYPEPAFVTVYVAIGQPTGFVSTTDVPLVIETTYVLAGTFVPVTN